MKRKQVIAAATVLFLCLVGLVAFLLLPGEQIIVVGLDSTLSPEQKQRLFEENAHEIIYPDAGQEICFRLEPGFYAEGEIYGEYLRFKADASNIATFVEATLGEASLTEDPLPYSQWHQGVGDYPWWRPMQVAQPVYYEDGRRFITVDPDQGIVYYSYVRSYSRVLERGPSPAPAKE
jgi:hypothetical protein